MNFNRYNRQIILPDFGISSQEKLANSSVLVVGAGGLGCPVLQILVSSGIGKIGIVDFDLVEIQNLHRQFLFDEKDIRSPKALVAERYLKNKNSEGEIEVFNEKLSVQNVIEIIQNYDVIADCTDNFETRYLLNDACFILKKPLVYASIFRYEGQVSVFNVEKEGRITNYRDLFPIPPHQNEVPNCNEAGVLPAHSAVIGTFQANEIIKFLIDSPETLIHQLLIFNTKNYQSMTIKFDENQEKSAPKTVEELQNFNYEEFWHLNFNDEINSLSELQLFLDQEDSILIDVRKNDEQPRISSFKILEIPLDSVEENLSKLNSYQNICFVCASGIRSKKAIEIAKNHFQEKEIKHFPAGAKSI